MNPVRPPLLPSNAAAGDARRELLAQHADILERVTEARAALLQGEIDTAREGLRQLEALLLAHAACEEAEWIPRLDATARWPARVYLAEHRQIASMLANLQKWVATLPARLHSPAKRLRIVDSTLPFLHVLEHHFEREEQGLFDDEPDQVPATPWPSEP